MTDKFKAQVFTLFDEINLTEVIEDDDKEVAKQILKENSNSEYLKLRCLADIKAIANATKITARWISFWSILILSAAVITFMVLWAAGEL